MRASSACIRLRLARRKNPRREPSTGETLQISPRTAHVAKTTLVPSGEKAGAPCPPTGTRPRERDRVAPAAGTVKSVKAGPPRATSRTVRTAVD